MCASALFAAFGADKRRLCKRQNSDEGITEINQFRIVIMNLVRNRKIIRYVFDSFSESFFVSYDSEVFLHVLGQEVSDIHYRELAFGISKGLKTLLPFV